MSELEIYEGCYVHLRNGDVVGPVTKDEKADPRYQWRDPSGLSWSNSGKVLLSEYDFPNDIVRVMPKDSIKLTMSKTYGDFSKLGQAIIPPHVTQAAMDAGIKADPAYEQFVNAILTAGFKAQYEIEFVPTVEPAPIAVTEELLEQMASVFGDKGFYELGDTAQQKLRGAAECAVAFFGGKQVSKNESENMIPDSEKPKGGLSGLPLEGVTICFTGSMNIPVDTHKGIAEALGAKVSGSVHSNTTLVVFGAGARSKFDKAIELDLPRMSESGWLWIAGLLGYGKPEHVSPYGKFSTGGIVGLRPGEIPAIMSTDYVIPKEVYERMSQRNSIIPGITLRNYIAAALDDWSHEQSRIPLAEYLARVMEKLISRYVVSENESENRISDSEKPKGGLSEIPSLREIHDVILGVVRDWQAMAGRNSKPSTSSIAKAFHRMLTSIVSDDVVHLVAPEGWYLHECKHEHTPHRFAGQTVTPSDHPGGAWCVDFQRLQNGGMLTGGRGKTLIEAWQNAVAAIKLAEEHELDI